MRLVYFTDELTIFNNVQYKEVMRKSEIDIPYSTASTSYLYPTLKQGSKANNMVVGLISKNDPARLNQAVVFSYISKTFDQSGEALPTNLFFIDQYLIGFDSTSFKLYEP
jgi:hypothetical protein